MKRFALITLFFSLASVLMCADIFAQTEAQDDKGVRQDSDNRWMTDGRHKRIPNANQIELYRRAAEQGHASAQKTLGVNRLVVAPVPHRIGQEQSFSKNTKPHRSGVLF